MEKQIEQYYRRYRRDKVKIISRILGGDWASAEDVVQEAFCRALRFQNSYDNKRGTIDKWFNSIMFNALREYQKESRMSLHVEPDILEPIDMLDGFDPEQDRSRKDHLEFLISDVTNDTHKRVLYLFFVMGYTSKEIAQIEHGVTQSNVTTIVSRFRERNVK